jgi:AraC-like DNA-binding protein/mannose-6-phosphate isomerase-like protein (cupin superfamily)
MRIRGRQLQRELVPTDADGSFLARDIHLPRFPFLWHYHPEVELTVIVRGSGMRFVGDSIAEFSAGDVCLLGADCPHSWRSSDGAEPGVHTRVVQFDPGLFGAALQGAPEMRAVRTLLQRARRGLCATGSTARAVADLVHRLVDQPAGSSARLISLLTALARLADGGSELTELSSGVRDMDAATQVRLGRLLSFLHESQGRVDQRSAARHAGLTPAAFSRYFHRSVGRTFAAYRTDLRLGIACQQLLGSDRTITAIAQASGFGNLSNFNRRFKLAKGMTPRAFRRLGQA